MAKKHNLMDIVNMMHDKEFEDAIRDGKFTEQEIEELHTNLEQLSIFKQAVLIKSYNLEVE